jgi:hypothetical protein
MKMGVIRECSEGKLAYYENARNGWPFSSFSYKNAKKPSHSTVPLKVPKGEIFDPFFFTSINPIWVR